MQQMITTRLDLTVPTLYYWHVYVQRAILIQMTLIRITIYCGNKQKYLWIVIPGSGYIYYLAIPCILSISFICIWRCTCLCNNYVNCFKQVSKKLRQNIEKMKNINKILWPWLARGCNCRLSSVTLKSIMRDKMMIKMKIKFWNIRRNYLCLPKLKILTFLENFE